MTTLRVGVLRGGPSSEYDVSLKTGATVLAHLPQHFNKKDIFIDRNGNWHIDGVVRQPEKILRHIDVAFNALHGEFGEDGKVQKILERLHMPYTGSRSLSSALAMNKVLAKKAFIHHGIKTPYYTTLRKDTYSTKSVHELFHKMPHPCIVKPVSVGSSLGVSIAGSFRELESALEKAFSLSDTVILEERIEGREATCGIIEQFRNEDVYSLPPIEIIKPKGHLFFDNKAKYNGNSIEQCPSNFDMATKQALRDMAVKIHTSLGLSHYSRSDFIVHPRRGIYALEVNTLPGLTQESLYPKSLVAIGATLQDFIDHLIHLAIGKKRDAV